MEIISQFFAEYEKLKEQFPSVYMNIKQTRIGSRWRIEIFNTGTSEGDISLLHSESDHQESAFMKALEKIKELPHNLTEPKGYTLNGQKVYRKI